MPAIIQNKTIRIVQLNMNGQYIVAEQLREYCIHNNIDLALVQEPPLRGSRIPGLDHAPIRTIVGSDTKSGAAIVVFNPDLEILKLDTLSQKNFAVISLKQKNRRAINFVSAYFKFSIPISDKIIKLTNIIASLGANVIIGADTNAHSDLWFSQGVNNTGRAKGRKVEEMILDKMLTVHNKPNNPNTYARTDMGTSNIDVTLSTDDMADSVVNWKVITDITDSDHRLIVFDVSADREEENRVSRDKLRFDVTKADWDSYRHQLTVSLANDHREGSIEETALSLVDSLVKAAKSSIPLKGKSRRKKLPPWWSPELTDSSRNLNNFRKNKQYKTLDRVEYKRLRNDHLSLIRKQRFEQWKTFCNSANVNPWGDVYKWAKKGRKMNIVQTSLRTPEGNFTKTTLETANLLLNTLVPHDGTELVLTGRGTEPRRESNLTSDEVKDAIWRIGPNKAPGKDGLTAAILRKSWPIVKQLLTRLYDRCLENSFFPDCWKDAEVVVLLKGKDKDQTEPKSYRPVSLLPTLGKVLETLIISRLKAEISSNLSTDQHGFTASKSTLSAMGSLFDWTDSRKEKLVIGVFLDISGAFDNLNWEILFDDLISLGAGIHSLEIIKSYLERRRAHITIGKSTASCTLSKGCPQGSQLGPILWNVSMDKVLKTYMSDKMKMVAYADDLVIATAATNVKIAKERVSQLLDRVIQWADDRGLKFSCQKTQVITLKGGLKPGYTVRFGNDLVTSRSPVKYLGVQVDYKRNFWDHLLETSEKSESMYSRMRAATSANWGIAQKTSMVIYKAVFIPRLSYAVSFWETALLTGKAIKRLGSKQRRALLSVTGAYKSTSTEALQVAAGCLPLDLELRLQSVKEKVRLGKANFENIQEKHEELLQIWQERWDRSDKGRWTYEWFPNVKERYWTPIELDHFSTQFITGHGDFNGKLHGFKLKASPLCSCGDLETARHVLFSCPRTEKPRTILKMVICRQAAWTEDVKTLVESRTNFEALKKFSKAALTNRTDR